VKRASCIFQRPETALDQLNQLNHLKEFKT